MTPNFFQKVLVVSGFLVASGLNLSLAQAYVSNKYVDKGGCYLQKEYNYFMNQWTTNEVCRPKFIEEPVPQKVASPYSTTGSTDNVYLGPSYSNSYSAPATTYYTGPSLDAIHTARSTGNSWNGYGNSANYLLGSFGVGGYYPSAISTYYPSYYNYGYMDYGYSNWGYGSSWYPGEYIYEGGNQYYEPYNDTTWNYCGDCSVGDMIDLSGGIGNVTEIGYWE